MTNEILPTPSGGNTSARVRLLQEMEKGGFDTITELCKRAGFTRNVYYDLINDKTFVKQMFENSKNSVYASVPQIIDKIVKQAKSGSPFHQKFVLQILELYDDKPQIAVQVNNITHDPVLILDEAHQVLAEHYKITKQDLIRRIENEEIKS